MEAGSVSAVRAAVVSPGMEISNKPATGKEHGAYTAKGVMLNKIKDDDKKSKSTELTNAIVAKFYSFKKIFPPVLKI